MLFYSKKSIALWYIFGFLCFVICSYSKRNFQYCHTFQKRIDGLVDFDRSFEEYKYPFGDTRNFWSGLDYLHDSTWKNLTERSIDSYLLLEFSFGGSDFFAVYNDFFIDNENNNYTIHFSSLYNSSIGLEDSFFIHDNSQFSTNLNCSTRKGGFWFLKNESTCFKCNFNGIYGSTNYKFGIIWESLTGYNQSLTSTEMNFCYNCPQNFFGDFCYSEHTESTWDCNGVDYKEDNVCNYDKGECFSKDNCVCNNNQNFCGEFNLCIFGDGCGEIIRNCTYVEKDNIIYIDFENYEILNNPVVQSVEGDKLIVNCIDIIKTELEQFSESQSVGCYFKMNNDVSEKFIIENVTKLERIEIKLLTDSVTVFRNITQIEKKINPPAPDNTTTVVVVVVVLLIVCLCITALVILGVVVVFFLLRKDSKRSKFDENDLQEVEMDEQGNLKPMKKKKKKKIKFSKDDIKKREDLKKKRMNIILQKKKMIMNSVRKNAVFDIDQTKKPIDLCLYDTAGQEDYDNLRTLSYEDVDIFLLCYSVTDPASRYNIEKWLNEIKDYCKTGLKEQVILVGEYYCYFKLKGTKIDLRDDQKTLKQLLNIGEKVSTKKEGDNLALDYGLSSYIECSSKENNNVKEVFEEAIEVFLCSSRV